MAKFHIGKKIEQVLRDSGIGVSEFARRIGKTRNVAYNIFTREIMNTKQLMEVSRVLNHNFFEYYSEQFKKFPAKK